MKETDIQKLLSAGFNILKIDYDKMKIKKRSSGGTWTELPYSFGSRTAINTRLSELLKHDKNIEL